MGAPITVRLSRTCHAVLREQAALVGMGPSTLARELIDQALMAPPRPAPAELGDEARDLLHLVVERLFLLEEMVLSVIGRQTGGADKEERRRMVERYRERATLHAERRAARVLGLEIDEAPAPPRGPRPSLIARVTGKDKDKKRPSSSLIARVTGEGRR